MRLDIESPPQVTGPASVNGRACDMSDSEKAKTLLENGIAAAQKGDRRSARLLLDLAVEADPQLAEAWLWLASISDYPEELLTYLDKVLEIDPDNQKAGEWKRSTLALMAKTLVQRAIEAHESNDQQAAIELLDQALRQDEACCLAWSWKAKLSDDDDEKLELLAKVLEIEPDNADAAAAIEKIKQERLLKRHRTARRSISSGDIEEALRCYSELSKVEPYRCESLLAAGLFADTADKKLAAFKEAAELMGPDSVAALAADVLEHLSDPDAAVYATALPSNCETAEDVPAAEAGKAADEAADENSAYFENTLEAEPAEDGDAEYFDPNSTIPPRSEHSSEAASHHDEDDEAREIAKADTAEFTFESPEAAESHEYRGEKILIPAVGTADTASSKKSCPFCDAEIGGSGFECSRCNAVLDISDMEMILSHRKRDREAISNAVIALEAEWNLRELSVDELKTLGIGHLNLGNTQQGLKYLEEACHQDPNDVILVGQTRSIAIRINEIGQAVDQDDAALPGKTILVVDDSATIRKLISAKLEKSGHQVITAEDGEEGLARLSERTPDLVLLDITMPKMDGYEVCKQIRANPSTKDVPVVMISGKDGFFDKVRGRMSGATGYVTKPFGPETLMKALDTYLIPDESTGD